MGGIGSVVIVGGGVIGLTAAVVLAKAGGRVAVCDRGEPGREASWAGAGIIPPGNPGRAASPLDQLRAASVARFPEFTRELRDRTGIDPGFRVCGAVEWLPPHDSHIPAAWAAEGIAFEKLSPAGVTRIEPAAGDVPGTPYFLSGCGQVRNPRLLQALLAACGKLGVRVLANTPVEGWEIAGGTVRGVRTNDEVLTADAYILAAGAWAESLLEPLGVRVGVRPVRGQMMLFRTEPGTVNRVLLAGKRYVVPRDDGRVLVGSSEEPEAGFAKATTPAGLAELRAFAAEIAPVLADSPVETAWAGLRPGSPDGMPFIGPVPGFANVFAAVGHYRAGIQLSIGTADLLRDLILGRVPAVPAAAFALTRDTTVPAASAFRS